MATLTVVRKGITNYLAGLVQREKAIDSYLNKVVVAQYRNIQRKRWMTENTSEDPRGWAKLNPQYAAWKAVKFRGYPGKGTKMMIRTGDLLESVIGPGKGFRKIVGNKKLILATTNPYASFANEQRNFTEYSEKSWKEIKQGVKRFLFYAEKKRAGDLV